MLSFASAVLCSFSSHSCSYICFVSFHGSSELSAVGFAAYMTDSVSFHNFTWHSCSLCGAFASLRACLKHTSLYRGRQIGCFHFRINLVNSSVVHKVASPTSLCGMQRFRIS